MNYKITHITSVHPRYDTRIFVKECSSLAKIDNYEVSLIVADGLGDEETNGLTICDVGKVQGRLSRILKTTKIVYEKAKELDSDIYHLHDPELMPMGLKLKKLGYKVIFDAHEDFPNQILSKPYLSEIVKKPFSYLVKRYERYACSRFDCIVSATPHIRDKFLQYTKSIDINNYPIINELFSDVKWKDRKEQVCYIGVISKVRGNLENVKAMENVSENVLFKLAGIIYEEAFLQELKLDKSWDRVEFIGKLDRAGVKKLLQESKVGLVTLHPTISYIDALPVKMFEYMLSGIPVIASDFKILKEIISDKKCGMCVNPLNSKEISDAINYMILNPKEAEQMGINGKKAVLEQYNWDVEEKKLVKVYRELLS